MEYLTFDALQQQLLSLFKAGDFEAVRQLAAEQIVQYPEQFHILAYWQITAAARQMEYPAALQLIRGLLERGFWYGESVLVNSPSLQPLQDMPEFINLLEASRALRARSEKDLYPLLILRQPERGEKGGPPTPLMIALHTNG
ncbi:MAG TPA: hypothetical protein VN363_01375, partial [Anaerolineales bacterium]|nr:hypothetical protein [Anaerolineales bacterium]